MGQAVWLWCFHEELWQHSDLVLIYSRGHLAHESFSSFTFYPFNWLFSSFNLLDCVEGHWIMHLLQSKASLFELWDAFTCILKRNRQQGAWTLSILWLVPPCLKEIQLPKQSVILFHANLSKGNIQRRRPVVDWYLCCVDMASRQIRGHHWVRRCQLIHHAGCISSKNPHRLFPPGLAHYRDTTSSQSITEAADNDNLIYTVWPRCFFFFPAMTQQHLLADSVISARNKPCDIPVADRKNVCL